MSARTGTMAMLLAALLSWCAAQPATVKVTVPDYAVEKVGDVDEVAIPGGRMLVGEDGTPVVPYWVERVPIPPGQRVKSVELKERSGMKQQSGLRLAIVQPDEGPAARPRAGVFPQSEFGWSADYDADAPTLYLLVYAVSYDSKTAELTFHGRYEFDIAYTRSDLRITGVTTGQPVYEPGDAGATTVRVTGGAAGNSARLRVLGPQATDPEAVKYTRVVAFEAADSVTVAWPTSGLRPGTYRVEVAVLDQAGNELDRGGTVCRVGLPLGEVTGFEARPAQFKLGDEIELKLDFRNAGSCDLAGECVFRVQKAGELLDEMVVEMPVTRPGGTRTFRRKWSTAGAEKSAVYTAVGFVRYEGTACEPARAEFSTNRMPVAEFAVEPDTVAAGEEVALDAGESRDDDGRLVEYRWDFGDGGRDAGVTASHRYMEPGDYVVRLTVVDDEGGTGKQERPVAVLE